MEKQIRNSKPRKDLTGKQFGYLTPLYYIKGGKWHCKCRCGNELDVDTRNLNSGHTQSCGCLQREKASNNTIDMTGYENDGIIVLEKSGSTEKSQNALWKCLCKHCGRIFITEGRHIRENVVHSCGCNRSNGEQNIIKLLTENNIQFAKEYTFPDLVDKGKLRFDFAIFKDNQLSHLIEFNGAQHYEKPQGSWADGFEELQKHDKMKQEYCQKHNIRLITIKYNQQYTINDLL